MEIGIFGIKKTDPDQLTNSDCPHLVSVLRGFIPGLLRKPEQPCLDHVVYDPDDDRLYAFYKSPGKKHPRFRYLYAIDEGNRLSIDGDPNNLIEHYDNGPDSAFVIISGSDPVTGKFYTQREVIRGKILNP